MKFCGSSGFDVDSGEAGTGLADGERVAEKSPALFNFFYFLASAWLNSRNLNARMMRLHCILRPAKRF
jgi:hypothetical protein